MHHNAVQGRITILHPLSFVLFHIIFFLLFIFPSNNSEFLGYTSIFPREKKQPPSWIMHGFVCQLRRGKVCCGKTFFFFFFFTKEGPGMKSPHVSSDPGPRGHITLSHTHTHTHTQTWQMAKHHGGDWHSLSHTSLLSLLNTQPTDTQICRHICMRTHTHTHTHTLRIRGTGWSTAYCRHELHHPGYIFSRGNKLSEAPL